MQTLEKNDQMCPAAQEVLRDLLQVWLEFERQLNRVPIIRRIEQGTFTLEDYKKLLRNLRPQVVEGARWITRAASSFSAEFADIRSIVIHHAMDEHRDYELIERDFESIGGDAAALKAAERNVGTEALAAFLMNQASQPNPVDLLGAMFIIEGLGEKMASKWALRIQDLCGVSKEQTRFLSYHASNDDAHMGRLYDILNEVAPLNPRGIVKTAKVVGRLYALQLEELDNV